MNTAPFAPRSRTACTVVTLLASMLLLNACDGSSRVVATSSSPASADTDPDLQDDPERLVGEALSVSGPDAERGVITHADEVAVETATVFAPLPSDLPRIEAIHTQQGYGTDDVIRIDLRTVTRPGPCTEDDESGCTLDDIIADTNSNDNFKPDVAVHFSTSDFADDGSVANAQLRQRGGFTRFAPQKSFRVRLDDKRSLWRGERKLLLNKHPYEDARVRNALAMELFAGMPHLFGSRTQFANLWIDDGAGAVDYGLFTHIEEPGSRWLARRGLDPDSHLYKPKLFGFAAQDRDALRVDEDGKPLDKETFENYLEIEAGDDHRALTRVMEALHDPTRSFQSVLDEHFNRNNLQAWLAMNILLHQTEAVRHNYLLFNPAGTERFYFVPWDYDATFAIEQEPDATAMDDKALRERLRYGYARNLDNEVIRRFLQLPGAHARMLEAADALRRDFLGSDAVRDRADAMAMAVAPWLQRSPDSDHLKHYDAAPGAEFLASIEGNAEALRTRFAVPMPPVLHAPELVGDQWSFSWQPAIEVTGSTLSYELLVSSTPQFDADDILVHLSGIADSTSTIVQSIDAAGLGRGTRYVRIIARSDRDPGRFWQVNENIVEVDGEQRVGMRRFEAM